MKQLRALVVDDEEPARTRVRELLEAEPAWRVVGCLDNGEEAIESILEERPDLVFLDIQMPEVTGFEVIRQVGVARMPAVVFVTAYDEYALQAFEASAVDYLLKPFADARFKQALRRCEERIRLAELDEVRGRMLELLDVMRPEDANDHAPRPTRNASGSEQRSAAPAPDTASRRIPVQTRERTLLIPPADIDYVSADGPYMRLHLSGREFLIRERMHALEETLAGHRFLRIHRSTLVNLDRVVAIEPYFRGEAFVRLGDGEKLKVSRSRRSALYGALGMVEPDEEDD